jgi:hypothetical protein
MSIACVLIDEVVVALAVIGEVGVTKEEAWSSIVGIAACFRVPRLAMVRDIHASFEAENLTCEDGWITHLAAVELLRI